MCNPTHESLAAQAAAYLAESAGAMGSFNGIQEKIRCQAKFLVKWARERSILLTDFCTLGLEKYEPDTIEHVVYLRDSDRRIVKCTKPGKFGCGHGIKGKFGTHPDATPWFYLRRLELMNQEFPTDLRLEAVVLGNPNCGNDDDAMPYIVTSQLLIEPANDNSPNPTEEEIKKFMVKLGFRLLPNAVYNWIRESDGIVVTDAKQFNFIATAHGIIPIDLIMSKI